jgi:hypothetical protein
VRLCVTVDGRRRGPHHPRRAGGPGGLEHALGGDEVVVGVVPEAAAEAVANAGLGGQVEHDVGSRQGGLPAVIQQVAFEEFEGRCAREDAEVGQLVVPWVVVGEAVDAGHTPAVAEESFAQVRADEAGRAGHHGPSHRSCRHVRSSTGVLSRMRAPRSTDGPKGWKSGAAGRA